MPIQIDGKTPDTIRIGRPDGSLATVGEARVWQGGQWRTIYTSRRSVTMRNTGGYGAWWEYISGEFDLLTIVTEGNAILRRGPGEQRIEFNVPVTATHPVGPTAANQFQPGEVIPTGQFLQGSGSTAGDITFTEVRA